jgi:hypothetical protein
VSAEELIDILEKRALLPEAVIGNLRQFVAKSLKIVTPESLAKLLVERGLLTPFQAKQLFEQSAPAKPAAHEDELSLAPIDDPNAIRQAKLVQPMASKAPQVTASKAARPPGKSRSKSNTLQKQLETPLSGAGPLDELLGEAIDGEGPAGFDTGSLAPARRRWGAPTSLLVWVAGGLVLVALIVGLIVALGRSNGDAEWQLAEKDFAAGADTEAIANLDAFLAKFPQHPRAGAADVYRNIARLRQAAASKADSLSALAIARDVLPKVVDRPDFAKAREGLSKLLPQLAARLVKEAKDAPKGTLAQRRKLAEAAIEAVALAKDPRYTPDSQKPWAALQMIEAEAALLIRAVDRQTEFEQAVAEISSAATGGKLINAFESRDRFLARFPELQSDDAIDQLDQELTQAEARALKVDRERHNAETKPRPTPVVTTTVIAAVNDKVGANSTSHQAGGVNRAGEAIAAISLVKFQSPRLSSNSPTAGSNGSAVAIFAQGTAYWINSRDGRPVGRQLLGFESFAPKPIEPLERGEFIEYDARHRELMRVKGELAAVVWRQSLRAPLAGEPVICGTELFCGTQAGRLLAIDLESGDIARTLQLSESLSAPPMVSSDGSILYLVTDRGNCFSLDANDFHTRGATRLGINRGGVSLRPVEIGKNLVVVDNSDPENSVLRVIASAADGSGKMAQPISLTGSVRTPLLADSKRLFVVTDRGEISVLAANGPPSAPLTKIAISPPDSTADRQLRFLSRQENQVFVSGKGITAFDSSSDANLRRLWQRFGEERVITAPSSAAGSIIVAMQQRGVPGVVVRGLDPATGEPKWETIIAAPLAGEPLVDLADKTLQVVHSLAGIVQHANVPTASQQFVAAPTNRIDGKGLMPAIAAVPYGTLQVAVVGMSLSGSQKRPDMRLLFADRRSGNLEASPWTHSLACAPVAMAENVVVADRQGEVILLNVRSGEPIATPFIMPIPREPVSPAVVSMATAGDSEIVVTDGRSRIFRLQLKDAPSNRLIAGTAEPLERPIVFPIAIAGTLVYTADDTGVITVRNVNDLKQIKNWPLGARLEWGPVAAADLVLAATDCEMLCFNSKSELVWRKPLTGSVPVGRALIQGNNLLIASLTGTVSSIDRRSGEVKKSLDLGEPLASGPVEFEKHWVFAAADGSLLFVAGQ